MRANARMCEFRGQRPQDNRRSEVYSGGKNLSTQKASTEQGTWIPQTHEVRGRPQRHQTQTRERPQSSQRVTVSFDTDRKRTHKRLRRAFACRMFVFEKEVFLFLNSFLFFDIKKKYFSFYLFTLTRTSF